MKTFVISVKKNNKIFHNLEKIEFDLDTSNNIVKQAEEKVSSMLSCINEKYSKDGGFSWKVYSFDGYRYMFVTRSNNWVGE